jgi:hypothetical protein
MPTPSDRAAQPPQPIDRLRRLLEALDTGNTPDPDDAAWFTAGAESYLRQAPVVRLDAALDLHPRWGEAGWWTVGPRAQRDAVLAEMDKQLFGQLDIPTAARSIVALARRRHERGDIEPREVRLLDRLAETNKGVPGERQIQNIIRRSRNQVDVSTRKSDDVSNFPT